MTARIPEPEETEMNMTPMIDIVFQLIVFFLLSLKFKSVDRKFESHLPKDRGQIENPTPVDELPAIMVKLFREDLDSTAEPWTKVRIGNRDTFRLPPLEDVEARREIAQRIRDGVRGLWAAMDYDAEVKAEIRTPGPKGIAVPHGDVMTVLDAFIEADLKSVVFQGAKSPMPQGYPTPR